MREQKASEDRPYLSIPAPSPEDYQRYQEWLDRQEKKDLDEVDSDEHVIIIEM